MKIKNLHKIWAIPISLVLTTQMLLPIHSLADDEISSDEIPVITVEESNMESVVEGQLKGEIAITIYEHPIQVEIVNQTPEGDLLYYDTEIEPQEGYTATTYIFELPYSSIAYDPEDYTEIYDADYAEYTYSTAYTLTISVPDMADKEEDEIYEEDNIIIINPHWETEISYTTYAYEVTFDDDAEELVTYTLEDAVETDGEIQLDRTISFLWAPYILGDVNEDELINIADASLILAYYAEEAAGETPTTELVEEAADVNSDGSITITDATIVLQYITINAAGQTIALEDLL